jgi:TolB-like protein/class 3 adenylate cyclase/Tfp pilus assembly protein PilF
MPTERRLAAIMFTDIVGYTALMAESEQLGRRVRERHVAAVRPQVERYNGEWIEQTGDESLSTFASAVDAVNCALAIQEMLRDDQELRVRVGVHLGEVSFEDGRVIGDGVNVASRVRPLAEPGGVAISDEVQHAVQNQENLETRSLGLQELKNVPRPVEVFVVSGTAEAPRPLPGSTPVPSLRRFPLAGFGVAALVVLAAGIAWLIASIGPDPHPAPIRSIAVLPLENLSGDPEQEYFADGMTEALIGDLAKLRSLSVISRTSVMRYKQSDKSLPQIARELDVDGVVEGTVMRAGDRVRITAQLIDARDDRHLWSDRYDRELSDVLALQSDVARTVADQVRIELNPEERAALTASRTVDPRAYEAYLRGLQLEGPLSLVTVWGPPAIEQFERAVEFDPDFAEAWAALARTQYLIGHNAFDLRFRSELPKAREAAQRALELDDSLGLAHQALGAVRLWYDWDLTEAGRAWERGVQLSPSDPDVLDAYAFYLVVVEGKTEEGLEIMERVMRLAPLDVFHRAQQAKYFVWAHKYERALEEFARARDLNPEFVDGDVAMAYYKLGRFEEAYEAYNAIEEQCGTPTCDRTREARKRGWAEGGWEGAQRAVAEVLTDIEGFDPFRIAVTYATIGETEEAFAWLERGYRERYPLMIMLKAYPAFDPLRSDPRFQDLLRRIGFPEN